MFSGASTGLEVSLLFFITSRALKVGGSQEIMKDGPIKPMGCTVTSRTILHRGGIWEPGIFSYRSIMGKQISWVDMNLILVHYVEIKIKRYDHKESFPDFGRVSNINLEFSLPQVVSRNLIKNNRGDRESRHFPTCYEASFVFSFSCVVVFNFS